MRKVTNIIFDNQGREIEDILIQGAYIMQNKRTGKIYVGSTSNARVRYSDHLSKLKRNLHSSYKFQDDYTISGRDNNNYIFVVDDLLFNPSVDELRKAEQKLMDSIDRELLLNISFDSTTVHTEATRTKVIRITLDTEEQVEFRSIMDAVDSVVTTTEAVVNTSRVYAKNYMMFTPEFLMSPAGLSLYFSKRSIYFGRLAKEDSLIKNRLVKKLSRMIKITNRDFTLEVYSSAEQASLYTGYSLTSIKVKARQSATTEQFDNGKYAVNFIYSKVELMKQPLTVLEKLDSLTTLALEVCSN